MPIQGQKFTIQAGHEVHQVFQSTNSFVAYNPNDGIAHIALDRTASLLDWDHRLPSQSGGKFPGPVNSYLSIFYQDQSGSGQSGLITVYGSMEPLQIPHFWSIGRALQTLATSMDITNGNQPPNPPTGVNRIWSDNNNTKHHLNSSGVDLVLLDTANYSSQAVGGDSSGTIGAIINFKATNNFQINVNGTNVQNTGTAPLVLPGVQGGPFNSVYWQDVGAGPAAIQMNSYGGIPANNLMRFAVPTGTVGGSQGVLTLDATPRSTFTGPVIINSGGLTSQQAITISNGSPALILPGMAGGVATTIQWTDAGAGITRIQGNTFGGVASNNVLRFDVATGSVGASQNALILDGRGAVFASPAYDTFVGIGNNGSAATVGFLYVPSGGGGATGVPANAGLGYIPIRFFPPGNALQAYLNGAWKSVTFT